MKKNKKLLIGGGILAGIALMAGTYAWLQSEDEKVNHFEGGLGGNDVAIHETWEEPTDWTPGQSVVKEVGIMNTGKYNELIRVSFKEAIQLLTNPNQQSAANPPAEGEGWLLPTDISTYTTEKGWTAGNLTGVTVDGYVLKAMEKQGPVITNPNTGVSSGTYDYVLYWEKDGETFAADGKVTRASSTPGAALTVENPVFEFVSGDYQPQKVADWMNQKPSFAFGEPTGTTKPTDPTTSLDYWQQNSQIDLGSGKLAEIGIDFVNIANALPSAAANTDKWFYNSEDGYFYYLAVVPSGTSTVDIINSVQLLPSAGNEYNKVLYDLTVRAEAIQPIADAVADEWGLATDSALYQFLAGIVGNIGQ